MKRFLTVVVCAISLLLVFGACSKNNSDDVNYIISFKSDSSQIKWDYELEREGIVTVTAQTVNETDNSINYSFILEAVGEGKTKISFNCSEKEKEIRKVEYDISVDENFKITATVISDTDEKAADKKIDIKREADAENLVKNKLEKENSDNEGKLFYETQKLSDGTYIVRVFKMAFNEEGVAVRRYVISYKVLENGIMSETKENLKDTVMTVK